MNPNAERLIRDSWMQLVPIRAAAAELFYSRLFAIDPTAEEFFAGKPMHEQHDKFLKTVDWLVQTLDYPPRVIEELQALSRRHVGYGVLVAHYETVGAALLWALEQGLGVKWDADVKRAWTELYIFISGVMVREATPSSA
ncbi:globin domain-containing protein [Gemmatimonas sp.]|jgi:hemoglobin-like flavoprotein|uniref:globin domain-containing protein n=1 Tax=Gemmatimonas sp. TaxID=1962908 RepID=UPI0037C04559